jgi:Spy/CpxP family protein refolding chaperone
MRRTWIIAGTATLVAAITAAPLAWAHQQVKQREMSPFIALEKLRQLRGELNLSDAQLAELRRIGKETREANSAYRASLHDNFAEAGLALLTNPEDIDGAAAILDRNEAAKKELRANVLEGVSDAIKVLSPEQREQLKEKLESRQGGF